METLTRIAPPELVETGLIDVQAHVRVLDGDVLLAASDRAVSTAWPEANGSLLVPEADVDMAKLSELALGEDGTVRFAATSGEPIAWRDSRRAEDGGALIGFARKPLTILMEDRRQGWEKVSTVDRFPRWGNISDLVRLMDVKPIGADAYEAPTYGNIQRNVVEGGQLLGGVIVAASRTDPAKRVVSAHAIFSRPAGFDKPLLVCHSQAGQVLPKLELAMPGAFARHVYVSCIAHENGHTIADMMAAQTAQDPEGPLAAVFNNPDLSARERFRVMFVNDMAREDQDTFLDKLEKDEWPPIAYSETRWSYDHLGAAKCTYVLCLRDQVLTPHWQRIFAERFRCDEIVHIDAAHQVQNTRPHALAEVLLAQSRI